MIRSPRLNTWMSLVSSRYQVVQRREILGF